VPFWKKRLPIFLFLGLFLLGTLLFLLISPPGNDPKTSLIPASALSNLEQERAKAQRGHEEFAKTPAGKIWEKHPYWDRLTCQKIASGQVWIEMSKEMAGVAVGPPEKVRTEKRGETLYEEWTVEDRKSVV
jgi:hypothetical protein